MMMDGLKRHRGKWEVNYSRNIDRVSSTILGLVHVTFDAGSLISR